MMETLTELEALQNHVNSIKKDGLKVHEYYQEDKRLKTKKYFITDNGTTITGRLDYEQMNHFLLGYNVAIHTLIRLSGLKL